jgi:hypothetical protein
MIAQKTTMLKHCVLELEDLSQNFVTKGFYAGSSKHWDVVKVGNAFNRRKSIG